MGVVTTSKTGVEIVCRKCKQVNYLFGITNAASFDLAFGEVEGMADA